MADLDDCAIIINPLQNYLEENYLVVNSKKIHKAVLGEFWGLGADSSIRDFPCVCTPCTFRDLYLLEQILYLKVCKADATYFILLKTILFDLTGKQNFTNLIMSLSKLIFILLKIELLL